MIKGRIVDLSHQMTAGKEEYGLKQNIFQTAARYPQYKIENGVWYIMQDIEMSSHCGTHVEFPFHHVKDGLDAARFPLEKLVGEAVMLDFRHKKNGEAIGIEEVKALDKKIRIGDMVLFYYDAGKLYYTPHAHDRPYVTVEAVRWLIEDKKIKLIGTDGSGFEQKGTVNQPVHQLCLENQVPILEFGANFDKIKKTRFLLFALPLPICNLESSPVRLIAFQ
ncbi:MAG: cyclase family protein [Victivallaceae bacterium]|nr:cyclase family protein [Victivallaceae bacterium]